eukprot:c623_g1_i1 orf=148-369(+)
MALFKHHKRLSSLRVYITDQPRSHPSCLLKRARRACAISPPPLFFFVLPMVAPGSECSQCGASASPHCAQHWR